jgi:hypothetical protein
MVSETESRAAPAAGPVNISALHGDIRIFAVRVDGDDQAHLELPGRTWVRLRSVRLQGLNS